MTAHSLDQVHEFLGRFIAYPNEHAHIAHTLWIAHTHLMDCWDSTPRIAFLSPEPGSGKTRAIEITELLVPNPVAAINVTPTYLFRKVGDDGEKPTILYDEIDTVLGPKARENEEIRGLLNAGHRRGAVAGRCVVKGKTVVTEEIPAYSAVALAGLGELPDTLISRSIVVKMRRRAPDEYVESYRRRMHSPEGETIRQALADWTASVANDLMDAWPEMPNGIDDRDADIWEALLAIADVADGSWARDARVAAVALVADSQERTPSLGIRLLDDIRQAFNGHHALPTEQLLKTLHDMDESPWADMYGKPLNPRGLSQRLRKYEVSSRNIRTPMGVVKGYAREDLVEVWKRYLPLQPLPDTPEVAAMEGAKPKPKQNVTERSATQDAGEGKGPGPPSGKSATSATSATGQTLEDYMEPPPEPEDIAP